MEVAMAKLISLNGFSLVLLLSLLGCVETASVKMVELPQGKVFVQYWQKGIANNGLPYYSAVVDWKVGFEQRQEAAITAIEVVSGCQVDRNSAVFGESIPNRAYPDKVTATVSC
jgi:hypothetical protein